MEPLGIGRLLIIFGAILLAVGVVMVFGGKIPFLGRLPGDLVFRRDGITIFVPIVTMILISIALTVLANVISRLFR
jgi:ABC-type enterochelin transport system permease subunit